MGNWRYAGFWRRSVAHLIDWTLLEVLTWAVQLSILYAGYLVSSRLNPEFAIPPFMDAFSSFWVQVWNAVLYSAFALLWFMEWPARFGTTPGKKVVGVKVIDTTTGKIPTRNQLMKRTLAYGLSYAPIGLGFLMAAFHPEKAALHELVSRTRSVR